MAGVFVGDGPPLLHRPAPPVATGREVFIGRLAELCMEVTDRRVPIATEEVRLRPADSEVDRLVGDASKARDLPGWMPRVTLEEGLARPTDCIRRYAPSSSPTASPTDRLGAPVPAAPPSRTGRRGRGPAPPRPDGSGSRA